MGTKAALPVVTLKEGRERSLRNRHPWIFSGAIEHFSEIKDGDLVQVVSHAGVKLGLGYCNRKSSITVRIISFKEEDVATLITSRLDRAARFRGQLFKNSNTTAYRLVNAEGDELPGLVIDRYEDVFVVQIGTLGMECLKESIVSWLKEKFTPRVILERSVAASRKEEGLSSCEQVLHGILPEQVIIKENSVKFVVDFVHTQKTGFFLDQREMRSLVGAHSNQKQVLNCFSFSGGFSAYAALHGATQVVSVDSSAAAIELARENFRINDLDPDKHGFEVADAFDFLPRRKGAFDLVVLDPPAFAKRQEHVKQATGGYRRLNIQGLEAIGNNGMLLTCSCSYFMDDQLFQQVVFQAAREVQRPIQVLSHHRQGWDHPVSLYHPEGSYLKSLFLAVV